MAINVNVANAQAGQLSSYANQLRNAITIRAISKNTYIKRAVNRLFFYFKRAKLFNFRSYTSKEKCILQKKACAYLKVKVSILYCFYFETMVKWRYNNERVNKNG